MTPTADSLTYQTFWDEGLQFFFTGKHLKAAAAWEKALAIKHARNNMPRACDPAFGVASMYSRAGCFQQAIPFYLEAIQDISPEWKDCGQLIYRELTHACVHTQTCEETKAVIADLAACFNKHPWYTSEHAFALGRLYLARGFPREAYQQVQPFAEEAGECCSPQGNLFSLFEIALATGKRTTARGCLKRMRQKLKDTACPRCEVYINAAELLLERSITEANREFLDLGARRLAQTLTRFDTRFDTAHEAALRTFIALGTIEEARRLFQKWSSGSAETARVSLLELDLNLAEMAIALGFPPTDFIRQIRVDNPMSEAGNKEVILRRILMAWWDARQACQRENERLNTMHYTGLFHQRTMYLNGILPTIVAVSCILR